MCTLLYVLSLEGNALLVHPVTQQGATEASVYFPGNDEIWYDIDTYSKIDRNGPKRVSAGLEKVTHILYIGINLGGGGEFGYTTRELEVFM